MNKAIILVTSLLASAANAQNCATLCDAQNWVMPGTDFIASAIANNEDVNALDEMGAPPIIQAIQFANPAQLRALIDAGADVDFQLNNGSTPLMRAALLYKFRMMVVLFEANADVNLQNNHGETVLHFMAQRAMPIELFDLALAAGADVTLQDETGSTAYNHALMNEVIGSEIEPLLRLPED